MPTAINITLMGDVMEGDRVAWTTDQCDTNLKTSLDPTDGTNATTRFTFPKNGMYKLCYQRGGLGKMTEQPNVVLVVTNASTVIGAISQSYAALGANTSITLMGVVEEGDMMTWATDCLNATANIDPTDGTNVATQFTIFAKVGSTLKLCYWLGGSMTAVEQEWLTLGVIEGEVFVPTPLCRA